jgi:hypothetical protein
LLSRGNSQFTSSTAQSFDPAAVYLRAAEDSEFFAHLFFPKAFRQSSPLFHRDIWQALEAPHIPFAGVECFRGSAKTTIARANCAKRISYGTSRTQLVISASQGHAARSVRWIKRQIETNKNWTDFYRLEQGSKWTDDWIEVVNYSLGPEPVRINIIALGITGQTRGLNLDDFRPDYMVVDDPCDEENTASETQRTKTNETFFGSLVPSLAPRSEAPNAKICLLQTGLHREDLIHLCHNDPGWTTIKRPVFTYGTNGEPNGSAWPERWSFTELQQMKKGYIHRGQLHVWLREYECRITSRETAIFNIQHLRYYEHAPENMYVYCGIDPASSEAKDAHKVAIVFWGFANGNAYLLDYWTSRGKNPEEIWQAFYVRAMKLRPLTVGVESISYQRMLAWYFRQKMQEQNYYVTIRELQDRRKKADRITQAHSGLLSNGWLYVRRDQDEYISALADYNGVEDFDLLDAGSMGLSLRQPGLMGSSGEDGETMEQIDEKEFPRLRLVGGCP